MTRAFAAINMSFAPSSIVGKSSSSGLSLARTASSDGRATGSTPRRRPSERAQDRFVTRQLQVARNAQGLVPTVLEKTDDASGVHGLLLGKHMLDICYHGRPGGKRHRPNRIGQPRSREASKCVYYI